MADISQFVDKDYERMDFKAGSDGTRSDNPPGSAWTAVPSKHS